MIAKIANNSRSILSLPIAANETLIHVEVGSNFPTIEEGEWLPLAIQDETGATEYVRATRRIGNELTVVRGQEETPSRSFAAGALVELRLTVAALVNLTLAREVIRPNIVVDDIIVFEDAQ